MVSLFGKEHLSMNPSATNVLETKPWIWGKFDRVLLMLQVQHNRKNCTTTRNVIFLLDTGSPHTFLSPFTRRLIYADCRIPLPKEQSASGDFKVKINGRIMKVSESKAYYNNTSILGMDYMRENNVDFQMKINDDQRENSILNFRFDTPWDEY